MLGWAGLRGATPIWLATFPVVAGVGAGEELFAIVFFVVVTSTLVQGASFEPLAQRLGLTTDEPALPRRLLESGRIRRMGGDVSPTGCRPGAAAAGHLVRELELPREALVNVIVRDGHAIPPRGSTELREGDELHILVRGELREEVEELTRRWHEGPIGAPAAAAAAAARRLAGLLGAAGAATIDDPSAPTEVDGIPVLAVLRSRRDGRSALVALADGRYAVTDRDRGRDRRPPGAGRLVRAPGRARRRRPGRASLVAGGHRRADREGLRPAQFDVLGRSVRARCGLRP